MALYSFLVWGMIVNNCNERVNKKPVFKLYTNYAFIHVKTQTYYI